MKNLVRVSVFAIIGTCCCIFNACNAPIKMSSKESQKMSGNGGTYDGKQARYFQYDQNNPCQDLYVDGSPMPNQILYVEIKNQQINGAVLARTQCSQVIPAQSVPAASLTMMANNDIVYLGKAFSPAPVVANPPSPNVSQIPPGTNITDDSGTVWGVSAGQATRNGVTDTTTFNITLLLFLNGTIYQETSYLDGNGNPLWWYYSNSTWMIMTSGPQY